MLTVAIMSVVMLSVAASLRRLLIYIARADRLTWKREQNWRIFCVNSGRLRNNRRTELLVRPRSYCPTWPDRNRNRTDRFTAKKKIFARIVPHTSQPVSYQQHDARALSLSVYCRTLWPTQTVFSPARLRGDVFKASQRLSKVAFYKWQAMGAYGAKRGSLNLFHRVGSWWLHVINCVVGFRQQKLVWPCGRAGADLIKLLSSSMAFWLK